MRNLIMMKESLTLLYSKHCFHSNQNILNMNCIMGTDIQLNLMIDDLIGEQISSISLSISDIGPKRKNYGRPRLRMKNIFHRITLTVKFTKISLKKAYDNQQK